MSGAPDTGAGPLGIIAGGGALPAVLAAAVMDKGRSVFVLAAEGIAAPPGPGVPHQKLPFGALGRAFRALKTAGCREVCFAGKFSRPGRGARLRPDLAALMFLWRNWGVLRRGDDAIHRAIASAFLAEGLTVVSPLAAAPALAAPSGTLTVRAPGSVWLDAFPAALAAAKAHGASDAGQAIVFKDGRAIAHETRGGTDAMLAGLDAGARGGVLVKAMKPHQLTLIDPPAIGVDTIERCAAKGLAGVLVEAGGTLVIDRDAVRRAADGKGLFVVAVAPEPAA